MNIVVTGGAGFIGSHLCKLLLDKPNNRVFCIDNLYSGSYNNIRELETNSNFTFIEHDIINPLSFKETINQIYNLACPASPVTYQLDPLFTTSTCFLGVLNMLELANKHKSVFLQASTSEVYGNPIVSPQPETYLGNVNPIGIRACYDEGKRVAETLIFDFKRKFNLKVKVARIFNTYGPNMQKEDGRVISNFIVQSLTQQPITVYGDGSQTRSFCFISDQVKGLHALMNSEDSVTGPINIGNPEELMISDVATKIIKYTGSKSKIIFKELPQDDPLQRRPDITAAKDFLDWSPSISLDEGLKKTIHYFKKIIDC